MRHSLRSVAFAASFVAGLALASSNLHAGRAQNLKPEIGTWYAHSAIIPQGGPRANFSTDIDLAGFVANGEYDDPTNSRVTFNTGLSDGYITGAEVIGLTYTASGSSWASDFIVSLNNSDETAFYDSFISGAPNAPGSYGPVSQPLDGSAVGALPIHLNADGQILAYVYDALDDNAGVEETVSAGTLRVHYSDVAPPPLTPPPGTQAAVAGGSITSTLTAADEVHYYSFHWDGGAISLDTEGSNLSPSNDTEIALWDNFGNLIASDDESGTGSLSLLAGTLAAGDYVFGVGSYNLEFGSGYSAVSGAGSATFPSDNLGTLVVNGLSLAPEPTSLAAIAGASFLGLTRRRQSR